MKKKSGFTLIELVVVMGIIAVLSSIAVPRVQSTLKRAKDTKGVATLSLLRTGSNLYFSEQGETLGKKGETLGESHIELLISRDYFDKGIKKMFNESNYKVPVGTVQNCSQGGENEKSTDDELEIHFLDDGISLEFQGGDLSDTNCKLWSEI